MLTATSRRHRVTSLSAQPAWAEVAVFLPHLVSYAHRRAKQLYIAESII